MQPLLIIGTQRSGSNMLRLMLNQVPEIAAPHPPHILQTFAPLLYKYGDLGISDNLFLLAKDICDFVKANPVQWEMESPLEPGRLLARSMYPDLLGLYCAVYESYAEQHGASVWCCKSMANLHYISQLEQAGLRPIYIHLVRDGRDVAASFRKAIVGEKHIYHLARQWKQDQEISESSCLRYAPERYIILRYEDLIHEPESTMRQLLNRLKLRFTHQVLNFYRSDEARHTADAGKMWDNVTQPVISRNSEKFLSSLSAEDIGLFESIAGSVLMRYAYRITGSSPGDLPSFTDEQIAAFDIINKRMKEEAMLTLDPLGIQRRRAQEAIIQNIKAR